MLSDSLKNKSTYPGIQRSHLFLQRKPRSFTKFKEEPQPEDMFKRKKVTWCAGNYRKKKKYNIM